MRNIQMSVLKEFMYRQDIWMKKKMVFGHG